MSEWAELGTKTGQRGLLIASYQRLEKRLDGAMTAAAETVSVPAHLAPPGILQAKQLCHLHTQLSLGSSCHRQSLASMCSGFLWLYLALCDPVDCGLPSLSVMGGSPGENTEHTGQYWLSYPLEQYISCCPSCQLP